MLAKEVAPFGIRVTVIEPGGFRTDFAGSSTVLAEGRQDYAETVGATVRFQREYDGASPAILPKRLRSSSTSPVSKSRRCGCCSAAMRYAMSKRRMRRVSKLIGCGAP